jgi:hypothetical protein
MTNEQKGVMYGKLLNEHTKVGNQISEIKGQSIDLNAHQKEKIKQLESIQIRIMRDINRLMS